MRRRRNLVRITLAAAIVAAAAPASSSSAAGTKAFTWSAEGCKEVVVGVSLATTKLQQLLPAGYTVEEDAPGTGSLLLGMAECASLKVEGKEQPRDTSADAVIPAKSRDGTSVKYHLWQVTGAPALRERMRALGFRGELSPKASAESAFTAAAATGSAHVPWSFAPYAVTAAGAKALPPHSGTMSWEQVTRLGTVETRFRYEDYLMHLGVGRVSAPAGSWLAKVLGGTTHEGMGILSAPFDVKALVTLRAR